MRAEVQRAIRAFVLREGGEMNGRALGYNGHYGHPRPAPRTKREEAGRGSRDGKRAVQ